MPNLIHNPEDIVLTERREIQAIMGNPPGTLLKWGITVVFFVVISLLIIAYIVEYADTVPAEVVLTTENPPIELVAKVDGKIIDLEIEDKDWVEKNQLLGIVDNPAYIEDVAFLEEYLNQFDEIESPRKYSRIPQPEALVLGRIQPFYAPLEQKLSEYKDFLKRKSIWRQINAIEEQIFQIGRLNKSLKTTQSNLEGQLKLAKNNLDRFEKLLQEGAESIARKEAVEGEYLRTKRRYNDLEAEVIQNQINIENLRGRIAILEGGRKTDRSEKEAEIQSIIQVLKSQVDQWKEDYLLLSPISGQVAFTQFRSENQTVQRGQKVMTIVPKTNKNDSGKIIGRAKLSLLGSGKVDTGKVVNIDFPAYPSSEYGIVKGKVIKISDIPEEGQYLIEIKLPDPMETTYGKTIKFRQGMTGQGEIITEKRRFLTRLLEKLLDAIYNR